MKRKVKGSEAKQRREKERNDNAPVVSSLDNRLTESSDAPGGTAMAFQRGTPGDQAWPVF